ncbi:MAG: trigger factor [Thermodesulfovibrionales bacterium]|nr:trigger factor [Thermodesulfovibrionales bacterium]
MVEIEDISGTKKRLRIEIPALAIEEKIKKALIETQKKLKMPGFRPGKVPLDIIEKRYGKEIEQEVIEEIVTEYYARAIQESSLRPVSMPVLEEEFKFERKAPLKLTFLVEVRPEIKDINYENIKIERKEVNVEDSEVEETLRGLQENRAVYEPVEEPAKDGDLVIMDYEIPEAGISYQDQVFKLGTDLLPKEFSKNIEGHRASDSIEFEALFPEDFRNEALAGKRVKVKVTLREVKRRELPDIDDELAKDVGFDNLEQLQARIRENLLKKKEKEESFRQKGEILNKLVDAVDFEIPEQLLQEQLMADLEDYRRQTPDDKRTDEEIKEELRPQAVRKVKASILLEVIGERENIEINEEDIKSYIIDLSQRLLVSPEFIVKYYMTDREKRDSLRRAVYEEKVLDTIHKKIIEKG